MRAWNKSDLQRLCSLHAEGLSDTELAEHFPERSADAVARKRLAIGLAPNLKHGWSDKDVSKARGFMQAGRSYVTLAAELNVSVEAARQVYRDLARGVKRGRPNPNTIRGTRQSVVLPSDSAQRCDRLKTAILKSIVRHANENGLDINTAATRLISMGVA